MKNSKSAIITSIVETTYENNTFWVFYDIGNEAGCEIVNGDKLISYHEGDFISVSSKPNINVCSDLLKSLINECRISDNEMLFCEYDEIEEDEVFKIQEEIMDLGNRYEHLDISECFAFWEDGCCITIYGGILTNFTF